MFVKERLCGLGVGQERSGLAVGRVGLRAGFLAGLLDGGRREAGHGNENAHKSDQSGNNKGKDPLEGHDLGEELADTDTPGKVSGRETHTPVLVKKQKEHGDNKKVPNEQVGQDTREEALVEVEGNGTVPKENVNDPTEGQGSGGKVDGEPVGQGPDGVGLVRDVEVEQVDKVQNGHNLAEHVVMLSGEPIGPEGLEQVKDGEVPGNVRGLAHNLRVLGVVLGKVSQLQDGKDDPVGKDEKDIGRERGVANVERVVVVEAVTAAEVADRHVCGHDRRGNRDHLVRQDLGVRVFLSHCRVLHNQTRVNEL